MKTLIIIILVMLILTEIILVLLDRKAKTKTVEKGFVFYGEKNKYLLTKNELSFFYKLKAITDKYNLYVFPKIRLADIINTNNPSNFNKIKAKHIDYTICDKYCSPILFIELDDNSHSKYERKENDIKKDFIMEMAHGTLIRVKINEIDYKIKQIEDIINKDRANKDIIYNNSK